ncbi:MAG: tetratricopeptide repeat protein [Proteobacteria bacterium]|nr:tetratricopeptide repeat protein [Pseudomonadota bacterium]MBU1714089.1 tetratricopeptide repeat protein [Pseudomonadota bacterium]
MAASGKNNSDFVKKELMMIVALITFVAGFLGGIMYSAFQSPEYPQGGSSSAPPAQSSAPGQVVSPEQARKILMLEKEVTADPQNAENWASLGHVYFDTNKVKKAINAYEKALALRPDNPDVWTDLGVMYRRDNQSAKAIESFERAYSINPKHEQSRFNKGIVLMYDLKDKEGAIKTWQELLAVNPGATAPTGQPLSMMIESIKSGGN